jgi:acyl-CoA reductase-like NAD-dependent aldehyde dehydrogenase
MTTPKRLSPAAQAALNAFDRCGDNWPQALAAALYAAAHHLSHDRRQLAAIATELEGVNG